MQQTTPARREFILAPFSFKQRVYIEDTDAGGIVFYANYLRYVERARTEFLRYLGYQMSDLLADEQALVVHSLEIRYFKPAKLDDELEILTEVLQCKKTSVLLGQNIYCRGEFLCAAKVKLACINQPTLRAIALPELLKSDFDRFIHKSST